MLKRLVSVLSLLSALTAAPAAFAANCAIPLVAGPLEPSQAAANMNAMTLALNSCVEGSLGSVAAAATTSGTSIYQLGAITIPAGYLTKPGNAVRVHAWGSNSADANAKTITFTFGSTTSAAVVTGSSNAWSLDYYVIESGTNTQAMEVHGETGTTVIAPVATTSSTTVSSPVALTISGTAATSGTITLTGATFEIVE